MNIFVLKRCIAFYIDLMIVSIIVVAPAIILSVPTPLVLLAIPVFYLKDVNNISVGKRLFNLQVVSCNGQKVTVPQAILRNITLIIYPVELIILLFNHGRRLGDIISKTEVIEASNDINM